MMTGPYEREVQYYETDRMQIVHHSNYIRWMEEARGYLLKEMGIPYCDIEKMGILIPVLSVNAVYRQSFRYGDTFQIYLKIIRFNGVKLKIQYEIFKKGYKELYTTAESEHCFLDENRKPFLMKNKFPELYKIFAQELDHHEK